MAHQTAPLPITDYRREIAPGVLVDVYDVLVAFNVTCPATAHAIKKLLCAGQRGAKGLQQDLIEVRPALERAIELAARADVAQV
jgi:hypothetical protein